jgi:hypothetical protein
MKKNAQLFLKAGFNDYFYRHSHHPLMLTLPGIQIL